MTRRKKPPPQHSKRRQITDSAGWTHVIKGPPGTIHHPTSTPSHLELGGKPITETGYTLETYLDRFRSHYVPIWKGSSCFENLSRILERDMLPSSAAAQKNDVVITRCVCLGLGSMTAGSESSSYELAALMSMLEILGRSVVCSIMEMFPPPTQTQIYIQTTLQRKKKCHLFKLPPFFTPRVFQKTSPSIKLIQKPSLPLPKTTDKTHPIQSTTTTTTTFQDPIFNPLDRTILQKLGHTVVETPHAFSQIDRTTFLFAPHLECLHYATALEIATPAVSVGSDLQVYVDG